MGLLHRGSGERENWERRRLACLLATPSLSEQDPDKRGLDAKKFFFQQPVPSLIFPTSGLRIDRLARRCHLAADPHQGLGVNLQAFVLARRGNGKVEGSSEAAAEGLGAVRSRACRRSEGRLHNSRWFR